MEPTIPTLDELNDHHNHHFGQHNGDSIYCSRLDTCPFNHGFGTKLALLQKEQKQEKILELHYVQELDLVVEVYENKLITHSLNHQHRKLTSSYQINLENKVSGKTLCSGNTFIYIGELNNGAKQLLVKILSGEQKTLVPKETKRLMSNVTDILKVNNFIFTLGENIAIYEIKLTDKNESLEKVKEIFLGYKSSPINTALSMEGGIICGHADGRISTWKFEGNSLSNIEVIKVHTGSINKMLLTTIKENNEIYNIIVTASSDKTIKLLYLEGCFLPLKIFTTEKSAIDIELATDAGIEGNPNLISDYIIATLEDKTLKFISVSIKGLFTSSNIPFNRCLSIANKIKGPKIGDFFLAANENGLYLFNWIQEKKFYTLTVAPEIPVSNVIGLEQEYQDNVTCPICFNLVFDPVECSVCDKLFCATCIHSWLCSNKKCPKCRQIFSPRRLDRNFKSVLENYKVKCCNNCGNIVKYENLSEHLRKSLSNMTPLKLKCNENGCGFVGDKDQFLMHYRTCQFRKIQCKNCNNIVTISQFGEHYNGNCLRINQGPN